MASSSLSVKITGDSSALAATLRGVAKDVAIAGLALKAIGDVLDPIKDAVKQMVQLGVAAEEVGQKFALSFGSGAEEVKKSLESMMGAVPESLAGLEKMAFQANNFATGLGLAAPQAAKLTESLLSMAATEHAKKMVDMSVALEVLERGLSRGALRFNELGIVLKKTDVEHEAFRLGLIKTKDELDNSRTALAAYSLLQQQVNKDFGATSGAQKTLAEQWRMFKRDIEEVATSIGNLILPALHGMLDLLVTIFNVMKEDKWGHFFDLLGAGFSILTGNFAEAGVLLAKLQAFYAKPMTPDKPVDVKDLLGGLPGVSSNLSPLQQLQKDAKSIMEAFNQTKAAGGDMRASTEQLLSLNERVLKIYEAQTDQFGEMALEAQKLAHELAVILSLRNVVGANSAVAAGGSFDGRQQFVRDTVKAASGIEASPLTIRYAAAASQVSDETNLRLREAKVELVDIFDGTRVAALELKESFRTASDNFSTSIAKFKQGWTGGNVGSGLMSGLQDGMSGLLASLGPAAIAMKAFGEIMKGLEPFIDAVFVPLEFLGKMVGEELAPYLKTFFEIVKVGVIVMSYFGEITERVMAGISTGVGKLLKGIGDLLDKLPGHVGRPLVEAGNAILSFAKGQYEAADQMKRTRDQLEHTDFQDAIDGVNLLGASAKSASEALSNLPLIFKINLEKFRAERPRDIPIVGAGGTSGTGGSGSGTGSGGSGGTGVGIADATPVANINLNGKLLAQITWGHIRAAANSQFGDPTRIVDVARI